MMAKTLTLRLNEDQSKLIEDIQYTEQVKTASKAIDIALKSFIPSQIRHTCDNELIEDLTLEIKQLKQIIENARSAAALLLEKTAQSDIFSDS